MQTDHSTVELFFCVAFTYCKLRVYKRQEAFARRLLESQNIELLPSTTSESWREFDTRVLLELVSAALPELIEDALPQSSAVAHKIVDSFGIGR